MTRKELARLVAQKTGLKYNQAEGLVVALGDTIKDALSQGNKVIYSNFGTFYTVHYPSKVIMHPKYGAAKKMIMLPTNVAKWMPSGNIKGMVNKGELHDSVTVHGLKKTAIPAENINDQQNTIGSVNSYEPDQENPDDENKFAIVPPPSVPNPAPESQPDINRPGAEKPNVYEELMKDGGREETTFDGVIRLHKQAPFWKRLFNKNPQPEVLAQGQSAPGSDQPPAEKIENPAGRNSMVGSGLFDKSNANLPGQKQTEPQPQSPPLNLAPSPDGNPADFEFRQPLTDPSQTKKPQPEAERPVAEKEISPFKDQKKDIAYVDLSKMVVPKELLSKIPEKIARQFMAVPISETPTELTVGMIDPEDIEARELIKKIIQKTIVPKLVSEEDVNHILDQYQGLESEVKEAIEESNEESALVEGKAEENKTIFDLADDAPAARIVSSLLKRAIRDKASDIHIEPLETEIQVRFRIDGVLQKKITLPKDLLSAIVSRVKIMSNLKIDEQRLPQDGRFSIKMDERKVDFRVSTMPTAFGEKVVMRILDKMTGILTVEQLGLTGSGLDKLKDNLTKSHGMILVTGPTGSGKTTTLYALIDRLFAEGVNIVTLEDPIEYQMSGINQSQVNPEIKYTFASGLRSIVRQDPDIIMIGEIRDGETAEMAVQSALTGHIVLSTLHTNDAAGAAPRLIDMGVEPFLLTSSVNIIIGQRLARKICQECKEKVVLPEPELAKIREIIQKMPAKEKAEYSQKELVFYRGKGCKSCGENGLTGRLGIFEVMELSEKLRDAVLKKMSSTQIQELAIAEGMVTMIQDGLIKALNGMTSIEEVWRVTKD